MTIKENIKLADYTSFGVGGRVDKLIIVDDSREADEALKNVGQGPLWVLGHGTSVLISDKGLPGTIIRFSDGIISVDDTLFIADAGVLWDDLVKKSIENNLWGLELMSGVPGSVGAAAFINAGCYGQSQADSIEWVLVLDRDTNKIVKLVSEDFEWGYKNSIFQNKDNYIIIRVAYNLSRTQNVELTYKSAVDVAYELGLSPDNLEHRREIILETRKRAGSLFFYCGKRKLQHIPPSNPLTDLPCYLQIHHT